MKKCDCHACSGSEHDCGHIHSHEDVHDHSHNHDHDSSSCGCGHDHGEITTRKQDIVSIILAVAMTACAYLFANEGLPRSVAMIAAIIAAGAPIFWQGFKSTVKLDFDELSLLTIAVTAAVIIGEYPEALLVTVLFRIGNMMEELAVSRSQREVEAITQIIPENANLIQPDSSVKVIPARELETGNIILIKSGERAPVDCIILSGDSSLDTSSLTGESAPREAHPGDTILSGSVNIGAVLTCRATSTFSNSTASRIIEAVRESAAKKGQTERMISRFARIYTPIVIVAALLVAVIPPLLGFGHLTDWIMRSLVFLVASCPCALVISIPLTFFAGIGACSKQGVLVKGSRYIEALAGARTVIFDKTGTLTTGILRVSEIAAVNGFERDEVLRLAALLESYSNHPIAKAVVGAYNGNINLSEAENCEEITSYGVRATVGGSELLCGSRRLMERFSVDISEAPSANVYLARGGRLAGYIRVSDTPRDDAKEAVAQLKSLGVTRTVMLTGDDEAAAEYVREAVALDTAHSGLLPQDKVAGLEAIKDATDGKTLYVGDGVNDAPVLARADAGIAMGLGSDSAIEAADVVLLSEKLTSLPQAIRIARAVSAIARFNIAFALSVKLVVFVLAFFGVANMWMAVFADVGVSILSVLNATRAARLTFLFTEKEK